MTDAEQMSRASHHAPRLDAWAGFAYQCYTDSYAITGWPETELPAEGTSLETLLTRAGVGDRTAFRALYGASASRLFAICLALLRDRARAEDALQEGFVRIWEHANTFDPEKGSALAWMTVITRRVGLSELRRREHTHASFDDDDADLPELAADLPEHDPIGAARLRHCLGQLEPDRRRYVLLAYLHGYTHEELARRFDRPLGTMKSFLFRGLAELRKCIS
jgi:RNA polymerase sigma-70 factor (ECF subfamily)